MIDQGSSSLQRTTGALLVLGFATMLAGALLFVRRSSSQEAIEPGSTFFLWERGFIMTAVILTVIGLTLLEVHLFNTSGRVLARVGATAYLFAGVLLVTAEALALSPGEKNVYVLIVVYVVLAFLAQAAIGGALLQSGLLPAWIGWMAIVWNLGWLVILPIITPADIYFPVLHHLVPLLIGIPLLLRASGIAI